MEITKTFYAPDRKTWRAWLQKNHTKTKEIWLVYYKKNSGKPRVSYQDALDEALCFGWIDGQAKGMDEYRYAQRFTPRRAKSAWSVANVKHYNRLLKAGLVSEAGKKFFEAKHRIYDPKAESPLYQLRMEFKKMGTPTKTQIRAMAKKYADKLSPSRLRYLLEIGRPWEKECAKLILKASSASR